MPTPMNRRRFIASTSAVTSAIALPALAQAPDRYPTRPITLVVPFPPGGAVDNSGRAIADRLGRVLGQPVIVENKGGAGGTIGTTQVAKAQPDGYIADRHLADHACDQPRPVGQSALRRGQ